MPDTPPATPWTEGPWEAVETTHDPYPLYDVGYTDAEGQWNPVAYEVQWKADAELIALAPDMAAAILAWRDKWDAWFDDGPLSISPPERALYDLATKLRSIQP